MCRLVLTIAALLLSPGITQAQTACPTGVAPGSPQCGPSPAYHGVSNSTSPSNHYVVPQPIVIKMKWADRWGAIAVDGEAGSLGGVVGMKNKKLAEKAALEECKTNGGSKCTVSVAYRNQCSALIVGQKNYYTQRAPELAQVKDLGMKYCNQQDTNCRIYYADCSMSQRIQ